MKEVMPEPFFLKVIYSKVSAITKRLFHSGLKLIKSRRKSGTLNLKVNRVASLVLFIQDYACRIIKISIPEIHIGNQNQ